MPINLSLAEVDERYELDLRVRWTLGNGGLHIHIPPHMRILPPDDDIVILSEPTEQRVWLARRGFNMEIIG
jgi:hypothetical protein